MDVFLKDIEQRSLVTWDFLIQDINNTSTFNPYCRSRDYYEVFKQIIVSLIIGKQITLLDSDFTNSELINLTGHSEFEGFTQVIDKGTSLPRDKDELIERVRNTSVDWRIVLFTSGTTGVPKKVTHSFNSIARHSKLSAKHAMSIWGFAYSPTHIAGLQVFFQALLNGNPIIRLFGLDVTVIHDEIKENGVTHISATPTFYRLLFPCEIVFQSVISITSGGEKFNENIVARLKDIFPNAKVTNVYASTEAGTLFASDNNIFRIKPEHEHLVRIDNNELQIHSSLMNSTDVDVKDWYSTGDLVEMISEKPLQFSFISRKGDMINVGGYKVNPLEVEEAILAMPGIKNVRVYPKSNSVLGNIVCCEVVSFDAQINEAMMRGYLQSKLQEFKIPRIIKFVDELSTTRTGKIKRN